MTSAGWGVSFTNGLLYMREHYRFRNNLYQHVNYLKLYKEDTRNVAGSLWL